MIGRTQLREAQTDALTGSGDEYIFHGDRTQEEVLGSKDFRILSQRFYHQA
jgi:hypothetical protein